MRSGLAPVAAHGIVAQRDWSDLQAAIAAEYSQRSLRRRVDPPWPRYRATVSLLHVQCWLKLKTF